MKILSSYTHPHVVSNLYEFLSSGEQKGRYLENVSNQTVSGTIDFHSIFFFPTMEVNGTRNGLVTDILLNIFLSVH